MKLIVGLGNPGRKYERTRHNLGFLLIDRLARSVDALVAREDCAALVQKVSLASHTCLLAKPQTFMNLSGQSVAQLVHKHQLEATRDLLVAYDDIALPVGRLRLRANGSAGGHNGMKSIIAQLGKDSFPRLRLGIKPENANAISDLADFVLDRFENSETDLIDAMLARAEEVVLHWLQNGIEKSMAFANAEKSELKEGK